MENEDKVKVLYDGLTNDGYDLGDESQFREKVKNKDKVSALYQGLNQDGYDLGSEEEFWTKLNPLSPEQQAINSSRSYVKNIFGSGMNDDDFDSYMTNNPESRQQMYETLKSQGDKTYKDYNDFENRLGYNMQPNPEYEAKVDETGYQGEPGTAVGNSVTLHKDIVRNGVVVHRKGDTVTVGDTRKSDLDDMRKEEQQDPLWKSTIGQINPQGKSPEELGVGTAQLVNLSNGQKVSVPYSEIVDNPELFLDRYRDYGIVTSDDVTPVSGDVVLHDSRGKQKDITLDRASYLDMLKNGDPQLYQYDQIGSADGKESYQQHLSIPLSSFRRGTTTENTRNTAPAESFNGVSPYGNLFNAIGISKDEYLESKYNKNIEGKLADNELDSMENLYKRASDEAGMIDQYAMNILHEEIVGSRSENLAEQNGQSDAVSMVKGALSTVRMSNVDFGWGDSRLQERINTIMEKAAKGEKMTLPEQSIYSMLQYKYKNVDKLITAGAYNQGKTIGEIGGIIADQAATSGILNILGKGVSALGLVKTGRAISVLPRLGNYAASYIPEGTSTFSKAALGTARVATKMIGDVPSLALTIKPGDFVSNTYQYMTGNLTAKENPLDNSVELEAHDSRKLGDALLSGGLGQTYFDNAIMSIQELVGKGTSLAYIAKSKAGEFLKNDIVDMAIASKGIEAAEIPTGYSDSSWKDFLDPKVNAEQLVSYAMLGGVMRGKSFIQRKATNLFHQNGKILSKAADNAYMTFNDDYTLDEQGNRHAYTPTPADAQGGIIGWINRRLLINSGADEVQQGANSVKWSRLKAQMDSSNSQGMIDVLNEIKNDKDLTFAQKEAAAQYGYVLSQFRGFNREVESSADAGRFDTYIMNAYMRGTGLSSDSLNAVNEDYNTSRNNLNDTKDAQGEAFQREVIAHQDDASQFIETLKQRGESDDRIALAKTYYISNSSREGFLRTLADNIDQDVASHISETDRITNKKSGLIIPVELSDGTRGYAIGDVTLDENGKIDRAGSGETVMITDDAGNNRQVSLDDIKDNEKPVSSEERKTYFQNDYRNQLISTHTVGFGSEYTIPVPERGKKITAPNGNLYVVEDAGIGDDGRVIFNIRERRPDGTESTYNLDIDEYKNFMLSQCAFTKSTDKKTGETEKPKSKNTLDAERALYYDNSAEAEQFAQQVKYYADDPEKSLKRLETLGYGKEKIQLAKNYYDSLSETATTAAGKGSEGSEGSEESEESEKSEGLGTIPTDEKGMKIYKGNASPAEAVEDMRKDANDDDKLVSDFIDEQIEEANKALKNLQKKGDPKEPSYKGMSIKQRTEKKAEWLASVEETKRTNEEAQKEAQATVDYWNSVKLEERKRSGELQAERDKKQGETEGNSTQKVGDANESSDGNGEIKPIGKGIFGNIYDQFKGKAKEAFEFLMKHKSGDLIGVFHREEIGDIDLVWGEAPNDYRGKGLSHIFRKHIKNGDFKDEQDAIDKITDVVNNGEVSDGKNNTTNIEKGNYRVVIAKDKNGNWILSAFDYVTPIREKKKGTVTTLTPNQSTKVGEAGAVTSDLSAGKDTKESGNVKGKEGNDEERFQKVVDGENSEGLGERGKATIKDKKERALRDALVETIDKSGVPISMVDKEGQRVLDEANGKVRSSLGDSKQSFSARQAKAEQNKGTVMPGLMEKSVEVVKIPRHEYKGTAVEAKQQAIKDAKEKYSNQENGNPLILHYDNDGQQFDYTISSNSIDESMNPKAIKKSENFGVHIAVLNHLDEIIGKSIEAEEHADYQKENGARNGNSRVNPNKLIHRFYGAISIEGKNYRVKTTLVEHKDENRKNNQYTYEVTNVEVLPENTESTSNGVGRSTSSKREGSYPLAKLLQGVEKSYEEKKFILEESVKNTKTETGGRRFFRTPNGEAYGFTVGGKIYIDPKYVNAETPIHEYTHLWASALKESKPEEWKNIVGLMKKSGIWDEVAKNYPDLKDDDALADEVLATYSGRRGAEKLRAEIDKVAQDSGKTTIEKAQVITAMNRVKTALEKFWKNVANMLGFHYTTADEVADKVLSDLLEGKKPKAREEGITLSKSEDSEEDEVKSIVEQAKKNGTYMKAPNGQPSKLSPLQWGQVRTRAFKQWFGDWEKRHRIEKLKKSKTIEISGEEYKGKYSLDRDGAKSWLKDNLKGTYHIDDTNEDVLLGKIGINKVTSHSMGYEAHLKSIVSIPEILKNAIFIDEAKNEKGNNKFDSYRYYVCGLKIGNTDYTVKITIGVKQGKRYYDHSLTEIEKGKLLDQINSQAAMPERNFTTTGNASLPSYESFDGKDTRLLSILQDNSSKIVDENGEPLIFQHGTPVEDLTAFDMSHAGENTGDEGVYGTGFYFEPIIEDGFSMYGDNILKCFLDIKKPFYLKTETKGRFDDLLNQFKTVNVRNLHFKGTKGEGTLGEVIDLVNEVSRKMANGDYDNLIEQMKSIFGNEAKEEVFYRKVGIKYGFPWSMSTFINECIGGKQFREALIKDGFDGVVVDNHREVVAFEPTQIKSATDNNGNFDANNPDIRYQFIGESGATKDDKEKKKSENRSLVGIHNISEEKLLKVIKQGALVNPSSAVIDIDKTGHTGYGDISLIMPKRLVDKKEGKNIGTYTADAWTPTYPEVTKMMSTTGRRMFHRLVDDNAKDAKINSRLNIVMDNYLERGNNPEELSYLFLKDKGVHLDDKINKSSYPKDVEEQVNNLTKNGSISYSEMGDEDKKRACELYAKLLYGSVDKSVEDIKKQIASYESKTEFMSFRQKKIARLKEDLKYGADSYEVNSFLNDVIKESSKNEGVDAVGSLLQAEKYVRDNGLKSEFTKWLDGLEERFEVKEMLYAGTSDRTGAQKYIPNTPENASRLMKKQGRNGSTGFGGINRFVAIHANKEGSLKSIRAKKDNLSTEEEYDKFYAKWSPIYQELLSETSKIDDFYADDILDDISRHSNYAEYAKKRYNLDLDESTVKKLSDLINAIKKDFPAKYFETKFERPVNLNEFAGAMIPEGTSESVIDALKKAGLRIGTYGSKEERVEKTNEFINELDKELGDGIKFREEGDENNEEEVGKSQSKSLPLSSIKNDENGNVFQRISSEKLGGSTEISRRISEASIGLRSRIAEHTRDAQKDSGEISERLKKDIGERSAEEYAKANGKWIPFDSVFDLGAPAKSGSENEVFLNASEGVVYKMNNLMTSNGIEDLFERIRLHNEIFNDAEYDFVGFTGFDGRSVYPIFRQVFVPRAREASPEEINHYMESLGFHKTGNGQYENKDYVVSDMRPRNVLVDESGFVHVIDEITKKKSEQSDVPLLNEKEKSKLEAINVTASNVKVPVHIVRNADDVTETGETRERIISGKIKGWFDPSTGEIYVYLPSNHSADDAVRTVLHEAVGHYGLRKMLGGQFEAAMNSLYERISPESLMGQRLAAIKAAKGHEGWSNSHVMEEYLSQLAEHLGRNPQERTLWMRVKDIFRNMMRNLGIKTKLTEEDMRYLLWRSAKKLDTSKPIDLAKDLTMRNMLFGKDKKEKSYLDKLNDEAAETMYLAEEEKRFREEEEKEKDVARKFYEKSTMDSFRVRLHEAQDAQYGGKMLIAAIEKESGREIKDWDNFYLAENQMRGINRAECDRFKSDYYEPAVEALRGVMKKSGLSKEDIDKYLFTKSGLERNRELYIRDHINNLIKKSNKSDSKIDEETMKTYMEDYEQLKESAKTRIDSGEDVTDVLKELISYIHKSPDAVTRANLMLDLHHSTYYDIRDKKYDMLITDVSYDYPRYNKEMDEIARLLAPTYTGSKDYSGLTELYGDDFRQAAESNVTGVEQLSGEECQTLWDALHSTSQFMLRHSKKSGMMGVKQYDHVSRMMKWYVPMRGWTDDTADMYYDYLNKDIKNNPTYQLTKKTTGRETTAKNPIETLMSMGNNSIQQDNRNVMKLKVMNLAMDNPTSLLTVMNTWAKNMGSSENPQWEYSYPDIKEGDDPETISKNISAHEAEMRELSKEGRAKMIKGGVNLDYIATPEQKSSHIVSCYRDGKQYNVVVNGNPLAAQGINGELTREDTTSEATKLFLYAMKPMHFMASQYTSSNLDFIVSNMSRDIEYGTSTATVKEGGKYGMKFAANGIRNTAMLHTLLYKYKHGELNVEKDEQGNYKNALHGYFNEFILNGGETGFTRLQSVDEYEKKLKKDLGLLYYQDTNKKILHGTQIGIRKGFEAFDDAMEFLNRGIEGTTRFTAYITSRESGKSIMQSINDAKEISVNFDRKGSIKVKGPIGKMTTWMRCTHIFWNAGIQGMASYYNLFKNHPLRQSARTALALSMGYIVPQINQLISQLFGDNGIEDDPRNMYDRMNNYTRRNNMVIRIGRDTFLKMPISIEDRAWYGMGEAISQLQRGNEDVKDFSLSAISQLFDVLPLNPIDGNGGLDVVNMLFPSALAPGLDLIYNKDYRNIPIYKKPLITSGNTDPAYMKCYAGTNKWLVSGSRWLNDITGGDDLNVNISDKPSLSRWLNRNVVNSTMLNPAVVEHFLNSYFSGYWNIIGGIGNAIKSAMGNKPINDRPLTINDVPMLRRLFTTPIKEKDFSAVKTEYENIKERMEEIISARRKYNFRVNEMNDDSYRGKLESLQNSVIEDKINSYKNYKKAITDLMNQKKETEDQNAIDNINHEINLKKEEAVRELRMEK